MIYPLRLLEGSRNILKLQIRNKSEHQSLALVPVLHAAHLKKKKKIVVGILGTESIVKILEL